MSPNLALTHTRVFPLLTLFSVLLCPSLCPSLSFSPASLPPFSPIISLSLTAPPISQWVKEHRVGPWLKMFQNAFDWCQEQ